MPRPFYKITKKDIESIIRVDHAGEYGAKRIYEGQLRFSRNSGEKKVIRHMLEQELEHLKYFDQKLKDENFRPTIFMPLWHYGGYFVGAISSIMGIKTAMLLTDQVEEVIVDHYQEQLDVLSTDKNYPELREKIEKFKEDELSHQHVAHEHDSKKALAAPVLKKLTKLMCRSAIYLSKRF